MSRNTITTTILTWTLSFASSLAVPAAARTASPAHPTLPAPTAQTKLPPIYDPDLSGAAAVDAAQKVAGSTGRRILVNLGTNDCEPCRLVNRALSEPTFRDPFLKQFIPVFVDVGPGSPNAPLPKKLGIDITKGLPAILIYSPDGRLLESTRNGEVVAVAKKGEEAVRLWIIKRFEKDPAPGS